MNWRDIQLQGELCDQDYKILELTRSHAVRIHGDSKGFDRYCQLNNQSAFCLIFFNEPIWLSEIKDKCREYLTDTVQQCYIGINRYQILGNDLKDYQAQTSPDSLGNAMLDFVVSCTTPLSFIEKGRGTFDLDHGRYFNFVQPLTWTYIEHATN